MKAILFSLLFLSTAAFAADVTCTSGSDSRILKINDVDGGCSLDYTKSGATTAIATQKKGTTKCEEVRDRIKEKLVTAGFQCQ